MTAAILRKRVRSHFVQIPNEVVRSPDLSFKAVGILAHILSLPDGSAVSADVLAKAHPDGRAAVLSGLRELTEAGYYRVDRIRSLDGTFSMMVTASDEPTLYEIEPECGFPTSDDPASDDPASGDPASGDPASGFPTPTTKEQREHQKKKEIPNDSAEAEPRADVAALCSLLADRIEANGSKRPTITKAWHDSARLLLDKDGRSEEQVRKAIEWCQGDEFWRANVLSMPTLRKQYDRLRLAAKRGGSKATPPPVSYEPAAVAGSFEVDLFAHKKVAG